MTSIYRNGITCDHRMSYRMYPKKLTAVFIPSEP
jgi:hypothetical protein